MRISTSMIYTLGANQMNNLQNQVTTTQEQISAGTSLLTPADNPVAAANAMDVSQQQSLNTQYTANRQSAESSLNMTGSALSSMTTLLQSVKSLVISAGNPGLTAYDRSNIATQVQSDYNSLLALANATDGNGNYLFGGYQTANPPFVQTTVNGSPVVQYVGDQGVRQVQISTSEQMNLSTSGQAVLQSGGVDVFQTLNNLVGLLNAPATQTNAQLTTGLTLANDNVTQVLNKTIQASKFGLSPRLNAFAMNTIGSSFDVQYSQTLSNLQGLNYAQAISTLTEQSTTLQAAQKSFALVDNLSLFNYIN